MTIDMIKTIVMALVMGGSMYGGIRSDLEAMHKQIDRLERMQETQQSRFDQHIERQKG